jgi:hypothetical protein
MTIRSLNWQLFLAVWMACIGSLHASEVIDFEAAIPPDEQIGTSSYATNGWRIAASTGGNLLGPQSVRVGLDHPSNGSAYFKGFGAVTLQRWDLGSFSLTQFDATEGFFRPPGDFTPGIPGETQMVLTGFLQNGTQLNHEFVTAPRAANDPSQFQTFVMPTGWTNLRRVRIVSINMREGDLSVSEVPMAFDNLHVLSEDPPADYRLSYELTESGLQLAWPLSVGIPLLQQSEDFEVWTNVPEVNGDRHLIPVEHSAPRLWFRIRYAP